MAIVNFQKPVVKFVLLVRPMPFLRIFGLFLSVLKFYATIFFLSFLLVFLAGEANVALLPKERLKVVTRDDSFLIGGIVDLALLTLALHG